MSGTAWVVAGVALVVGGLGGTGVGVAGTLVVTAALHDDDAASPVAGAGEPAADVLPEALPRLRAFVAQERDLEWVSDVPVRVLDGEAFEDALHAPGDTLEPALDDPDGGRAETYAALGLTPSAEDYRAAWGSGDAAVLGFYDDEAEEVVLRGSTWDALVEATLVHELTHALDDQHADLGAVDDTVTGAEAASAWGAVVEGDAQRVEDAYTEQQDVDHPGWYDAYERALEASWEEMDDTGGSWDPLVEALTSFPYADGAWSVGLLVDAGGNAAVDAALADPPTTTEQVLLLDDWHGKHVELAPAVPLPAPAAPPGARVLGSDVLGVEVLSMLPQAEDAQGLDGMGYWVDEPLEGWAGDAWTTWVDPADDDRACTEVSVLLDDASARDHALRDLEPWAEAGSGTVEAVGDAGLRLHSCGDLT